MLKTFQDEITKKKVRVKLRGYQCLAVTAIEDSSPETYGQLTPQDGLEMLRAATVVIDCYFMLSGQEIQQFVFCSISFVHILSTTMDFSRSLPD